MNTEELQALYPGIKLPPLVTVDGVAIEPGMTLWDYFYSEGTNEYELYSFVFGGDLHLRPNFRELTWYNSNNYPLTRKYSSKTAVINGIIRQLIVEKHALLARIIAWEAQRE